MVNHKDDHWSERIHSVFKMIHEGDVCSAPRLVWFFSVSESSDGDLWTARGNEKADCAAIFAELFHERAYREGQSEAVNAHHSTASREHSRMSGQHIHACQLCDCSHTGPSF